MATTRWKKWLLWFLVLTPVCYAAVIFWRLVNHSGHVESRSADASVVFGAAEYVGRPSPVYKARLDRAAQLFHRGLAPIVITTGGSGGDPRFSEGVVGREYLKTLGIPDSQLIAETQSDDTAESARRVSTIMYVNSMRSCLAVSDGYHIFRIKQMLAREGVIAYGAPRPNSRPQSFWKRQESAWHEIGSYTLWLFHLT
jgi:uncharacterized SAM-binding protein YcdF (DUF218 family)